MLRRNKNREFSLFGNDRSTITKFAVVRLSEKSQQFQWLLAFLYPHQCAIVR
ncbi:MAG: hypothetical protein HQL77_18990 [Magnetococcales bacterium]|nr:hypothetical protein [Magnetococcales bacterium]